MEHSKETEQGLFNIKREVDSMDDFEHLEHDSSPLQDLLGLKSDKEVTAPETVHEINNTPKTGVSHQTGAADLLASLIPDKMNRNLLEDDFLESEHDKDKLDQFLQGASNSPSDHGDNKLSSANLIEAEKVSEPQTKEVDQFLDFEQDISDPLHLNDNIKSKSPEPEPIVSAPSVHPVEPEISVSPSPEPPKAQEPEKTVTTVTTPVVEKKVEIQEKLTKKIAADKPAVVTPAKIAPTDAAAIFCQMGLDAWFNPEKLDPKAEAVKSKWRTMRDNFRKELNKMQGRSGAEGGKKPKWIYFEAMSFVTDTITSRPSSGNISMTDKNSVMQSQDDSF